MRRRAVTVPPASKAARAAIAVASEVSRAVFREGARADRELARLLPARGDLDDAGRAFAHAATMALFRWWGWVRAAARERFAAAVALASLLESDAPAPPALRALAAMAGLDPRAAGAAGRRSHLHAKSAWLARVLDLREAPSPVALFPEWAVPHLVPPIEEKAALALLEALQHAPRLFIRAQGERAGSLAADLGQEGVKVRAEPGLARAFEVTAGPDLYRTASFAAGRFEVQDVSSQRVVAACAPAPGERWWDACAGAGGKALALADALGAGGEAVLATDVDGRKLDELRRRARRAGLGALRVESWREGAALPPAARAGFDGVLVDAPCSSSGTWRRNPDARWRTTDADVRRLAALARAILERAARAVKPGGRLVYATCSFSRVEDEEVAAPPLAGLDGRALEPAGCERILEGGDAMFVARWRAPA